MPIALYKMPDGTISEVEVPEGTTPEQAQSMAANAAKPDGKSFLQKASDYVVQDFKHAGNVAKEAYFNMGRGSENVLIGQAQAVLPEGTDTQTSLADRAAANKAAIEKSGFLKGSVPAFVGETATYATELLPVSRAAAYAAPFISKLPKLGKAATEVGKLFAGKPETLKQAAQQAVAASPAGFAAGYTASAWSPVTGATEEERNTQREARNNVLAGLAGGVFASGGKVTGFAVKKAGDWLSMTSLADTPILKQLGITSERGLKVAKDKLDTELNLWLDATNKKLATQGIEPITREQLANETQQTVDRLIQLGDKYGTEFGLTGINAVKNKQVVGFFEPFLGPEFRQTLIASGDKNKEAFLKVLTEVTDSDDPNLVVSRLAGFRAKEASKQATSTGLESLQKLEKEVNAKYAVVNDAMQGAEFPQNWVVQRIQDTAAKDKVFEKEILAAVPSGLREIKPKTKLSYNEVLSARNTINRQVNALYGTDPQKAGQLESIRDTMDGILDDMVKTREAAVPGLSEANNTAKAFYRDEYQARLKSTIPTQEGGVVVQSEAAKPLLAAIKSKTSPDELSYMDNVVSSDRNLNDFIRLNDRNIPADDAAKLAEQHLNGKLALSLKPADESLKTGNAALTAITNFKSQYGDTLNNPSMAGFKQKVDDLEEVMRSEWYKIEGKEGAKGTYERSNNPVRAFLELAAIKLKLALPSEATRFGAGSRMVVEPKMQEIADSIAASPEAMKQFLNYTKDPKKNFTPFFSFVTDNYLPLVSAASVNVPERNPISEDTAPKTWEDFTYPDTTNPSSQPTWEDFLGKAPTEQAPTSLAPQSKLDPDTTPAPTTPEEHAKVVVQAAKMAGVSPELAVVTMSSESSMGQNTGDSKYVGPMQMGPAAREQAAQVAKQYAGLDLMPYQIANNPVANIIGGAAYLRYCKNEAQKSLGGREPKPWEVYFAYANGPAAFKVFEQLRKQGDDRTPVISAIKRANLSAGNSDLMSEKDSNGNIIRYRTSKEVEQAFINRYNTKLREALPYARPYLEASMSV